MHLSGGHGLGDKTLEGKLLLLEVLSSALRDLKSSHGVGDGALDLLLLVTLKLKGKSGVGDDLLNTANVGLELLLSLKLLLESIIVALELLSLVDHLLDLVGGELSDGVGDGDVGTATRGLLSSGDLEDTVDVDLEDTLEDGLTGAHGGDRSKSEFTQAGVVLTVGSLTLVDGELNGLLVVGNSGEGSLLEGGAGGTTGNDGGEDVALHGDTERQRNDIEEEEVGGLSRGGLSGEDTGLDGGTVGNSLIGVDALLELLAVEELGQKLLDLGDTGGTTDKDDLVNGLLLDSSVLEDLSNGLDGARESLGVQVLETGTGDGHGEVLTVEERVNLNGGLGTAGESTLGTLTSSSETSEGTGIAREVLLYLAAELLLAVIEEIRVEVLATKMGTLMFELASCVALMSVDEMVDLLSGSSLNSEDTTLDVEEGDIESTTTEIVDENVTLLLRLTGTKTVGDGGGGRFVDDTEDVEAGNGTGVLGGLTLVVVEVGRNGDDGLLNLLAELGLGNLLHLFGGREQNSLGIEDSVAGVHGSIVLGGLTDQTLLLGEGNERRGGERTLLVGDDLDIGTLVGSNAGVGGT
ncbi:unnamed protein product [Fusarium graminearum]|nr:unnamed protein product [Fusarium graminearum]